MSSRPKKSGQCAYCGEKRPITDDHIPPRNLFPKPRASNLITVPCCEPCRKGWSEDDEYFRVAILSSEKVSEEPSSQGSVDSLLRSLYRPEQRGFARMVSNSIEEVEILTEGGIYLGRTPAFRLQTERIDRVAQRIVRGLFFHEKNYPLPKDYQVFTSIQQFGIDHQILEILQGMQLPKVRVVQDGVFCYTFKEVEEDPNSGIWLLKFYKNLDFIGMVKTNSEVVD